jgi:hypothetical protein
VVGVAVSRELRAARLFAGTTTRKTRRADCTVGDSQPVQKRAYNVCNCIWCCGSCSCGGESFSAGTNVALLKIGEMNELCKDAIALNMFARNSCLSCDQYVIIKYIYPF